jgi:hypothetical protein
MPLEANTPFSGRDLFNRVNWHKGAQNHQPRSDVLTEPPNYAAD